MRTSAIPLLTVTIYVTAVAIPLVTATDARADSQHARKHHQRTNLGMNNSWRRASAAGEVRPVAPSWSGGGEVCAGNARGIDCKIWPPPIDEDPDRKASSDGM
jgi:hypothetical protein